MGPLKIFLIFWGAGKLFPCGCKHFTFPSMQWESSFHSPLPTLTILIAPTLVVGDGSSLGSWSAFPWPWWWGLCFLCLLVIYLSSLEKCAFKSLPIFNLGYLSSYYWVARVLYIFDSGYKSLIIDVICTSTGSLYTFSMVFFEAQRFPILLKSKLLIFFFNIVIFVSYLRNHCLIHGHTNLLLYFLLRVLYSELSHSGTLRFELTFLFGLRQGHEFFAWEYPADWHQWWERRSFCPLNCPGSFIEDQGQLAVAVEDYSWTLKSVLH